MANSFEVLEELLARRENSPYQKQNSRGEKQLAWAVIAQWMRDVLTILNGGQVFDETKPPKKRRRARPGRPKRRLLTLKDLRDWLETEDCSFWVEGVLGVDVDYLRQWFDEVIEAYQKDKSLPKIVNQSEYKEAPDVTFDFFEVHLPQESLSFY